MEIGVGFPLDFGTDPVAIRDYVQAAESLGYAHITTADHILWAPRGELQGSETHQALPHFDPFVLYSFMAAATSRISFVTTVVLLPQRPAVLVAKQAAALDVLSGGRLRLGVAVGWDPIDYEAMNETFANRGRRMDEQIEVMRALWTNELVDYHGKWHNISHAGLSPMPLQRPIPIWVGGYAEGAMRRAARLGDGWFVQPPPDDRTAVDPVSSAETFTRLRSYLADAGRDVTRFGIHVLSSGIPARSSPDTWRATAEAWQALGATHLTFNTAHKPSPTVDDRIAAMREFKQTMGF